MSTNLQLSIERQRVLYDTLAKPLLYQLWYLHRLTIRDFAQIFGVSKGHAEAVLKHRVEPSLDLALRVARYFGVTVEELFGWRFDDTGDRRPLIVEVDGKVEKVEAYSNPLELVTHGN